METPITATDSANDQCSWSLAWTSWHCNEPRLYFLSPSVIRMWHEVLKYVDLEQWRSNRTNRGSPASTLKNKTQNVTFVVHWYYMRFVPKVSVLNFLSTTWECSTLLMYIGELVMTSAACTYLFKLDRLSLSWAIAACVRSCFITSVTSAMQPWYCSQIIFASRTDS
jgi:hypothetical protein